MKGKTATSTKIILLALSILCAALLPGWYPAQAAESLLAGSISSFTVSGPADMVNTMSTDKAQPVALLETMLREAAVSTLNRADAKEIATITTKNGNATATVYTIYLHQDTIYASRGGSLYAISSASFHKLLNAFQNSFYKYRAVPQLTIVQNSASSGALTVEKNSYIFKKLDGKFYIPFFTQKENKWVLDGTAAKWPDLHFSLPGATDITARVYDSTGKQQFSGTWTAAGSYVQSHPGSHRLQVDAKWKTELYSGSVTYAFAAKGDNRAPALSQDRFSIKGGNTYPGEALVLQIANYQSGEKISFSSDINVIPNFFDDGAGGKIALMPVSYFIGTGAHTISLSCGDTAIKWSISVQDKKFQIQNLTVSESTASSTINDQNANAEYEKHIAPLRFVTDAQRHYDSFIWPVTGPRSTEFGMIRYVNGAPTSSRHGAIDFAVPKGTPVKATANGRVLYAGFLQLTGNTVLIEHGYGLKSWYYHMDSLGVETGDMVTMSQEIGKVGSTGFSTGAHLHFGMSINNVFVNPDTIIDTDLLA